VLLKTALAPLRIGKPRRRSKGLLHLQLRGRKGERKPEGSLPFIWAKGKEEE